MEYATKTCLYCGRAISLRPTAQQAHYRWHARQGDGVLNTTRHGPELTTIEFVPSDQGIIKRANLLGSKS